MTTQTIPEASLHIESKDNLLGLYQFGAKTAKHYFCKKCGIYTFHETVRFPGELRVNIGCLVDVEGAKLDSDLFDGKNLL